MNLKTILYILYVSITTVMIISMIEYLLPGDANNPKDDNFGDVYRIIDPHLGWAHWDKESRVDNLRKRGYSWLQGFAIYKKCSSHLSRPIILTLGGSTTDGVKYDHSWPEELEKIFVTNGQQGSIINGGVGGYSSNQELLKLIRDGLIFNPDIVISYSGVNDDREKQTKDELIVHPMVNKQQLAILKYLTREPYILPNIRSWLNIVRYGKNETLGYTLGLDNNRTRSENFEENMLIMDAASRAQGAIFFGIIQPNAYFNSRHGRGVAAESREEVRTLLNFYSEIVTLPAKHKFIYDFTGIFEKHDDVYLADGIHTTQKGDNIIAQNIYELISPQLKRASMEVNSRPVEAAGEACN
jgi:lysophospholipase L1-like esterase